MFSGKSLNSGTPPERRYFFSMVRCCVLRDFGVRDEDALALFKQYNVSSLRRSVSWFRRRQCSRITDHCLRKDSWTSP